MSTGSERPKVTHYSEASVILRLTAARRKRADDEHTALPHPGTQARRITPSIRPSYSGNRLGLDPDIGHSGIKLDAPLKARISPRLIWLTKELT